MLKTKLNLFPSKPPTFSASLPSDSSMPKTSVIFSISRPIVTKRCQFSFQNVSCICLPYPSPLSKPYHDLTHLLTLYLSAHHFYRQSNHPSKADHSWVHPLSFLPPPPIKSKFVRMEFKHYPNLILIEQSKLISHYYLEFTVPSGLTSFLN